MPPTEFAVRNPVEIVEREILAEFEDAVPRGEISWIAAEEVAVFQDAKVRDFVPILALRRARARASALAEGRASETPERRSMPLGLRAT